MYNYFCSNDPLQCCLRALKERRLTLPDLFVTRFQYNTKLQGAQGIIMSALMLTRIEKK